jgi:hypothetical protein
MGCGPFLDAVGWFEHYLFDMTIPSVVSSPHFLIIQPKRIRHRKNKPRWYPQKPQRFHFTNLSEACSEAKRWKHLSWVSMS